jgi:transcriptional regulator with XRE-family HTH domain
MTQTKASRDPALVQFGAAVRTLRERSGKPAAEVAAELGVSDRTLYRVERGECRVSNRTYWKLADSLGVDVDPVLRKVA